VIKEKEGINVGLMKSLEQSCALRPAASGDRQGAICSPDVLLCYLNSIRVKLQFIDSY
jgi:hypothetical protein